MDESAGGSSCVSFNPIFKKTNMEHELKPRKREWENQFYPNVMPMPPPEDRSNLEDRNSKAAVNIVNESPGSNAYLDHIKARLKIKSQGCNSRPRPSHFMRQSFNSLRGISAPRGTTTSGISSGEAGLGGPTNESIALSHA